MHTLDFTGTILESIVIVQNFWSDLKVHKQNLIDIFNRSFYGDKI